MRNLLLTLVLVAVSSFAQDASDTPKGAPKDTDQPRFENADPGEYCPGRELWEENHMTPACGFNDAGVPKAGKFQCGLKPPNCEKSCRLVECLPDP